MNHRTFAISASGTLAKAEPDILVIAVTVEGPGWLKAAEVTHRTDAPAGLGLSDVPVDKLFGGWEGDGEAEEGGEGDDEGEEMHFDVEGEVDGRCGTFIVSNMKEMRTLQRTWKWSSW